MWRLSKEIINCGSGLRKPARYDESTCKLILLNHLYFTFSSIFRSILR